MKLLANYSSPKNCASAPFSELQYQRSSSPLFDAQHHQYSGSCVLLLSRETTDCLRLLISVPDEIKLATTPSFQSSGLRPLNCRKSTAPSLHLISSIPFFIFCSTVTMVSYTNLCFVTPHPPGGFNSDIANTKGK